MRRPDWLNSTVLGVGLASLCSDWSHEVATTVMPVFVASLGVGAAWIGLIEGLADGLSGLAKMSSGYYTDQLARRKPVMVLGYLITALGTASFGLASQAWHVLLARSGAWLGRGVRTPLRKAMLVAAVTPATYGRALGFERMMDTLGAILGPLTALYLLGRWGLSYPQLFALTLVPGLLACVALGLGVREVAHPRIKYQSIAHSLRGLGQPFRRYLAAVGVFGLGDFSHTLMIMWAAVHLAPGLGVAAAARAAAALYVVHNVCNAAVAPLAGWLLDHGSKRRVLVGGYLVAAGVSLVLMLPVGGGGWPLVAHLGDSLWALGVLFGAAGAYLAVVETAEDALAAELVDEASHGMAFGTLATVNALGDMVSSIVVGALWSWLGVSVAFGYSAVLSLLGALLVARTAAFDRA
jgi:MFS family permease